MFKIKADLGSKSVPALLKC